MTRYSAQWHYLRKEVVYMWTCPKCVKPSDDDIPHVTVEGVEFCIPHAGETTILGYARWRDYSDSYTGGDDDN